VRAAAALDVLHDLPWTPQTGPQFDAIQARQVDEMLYGGALGGGKSDFLLGDFLQDVPIYGSAWRGILFRRTMGELQDIIERSKEIYPRTGAFYSETHHMWRWPNGASLRMRFLELDKHKLRYQGHAFTFIGWDELTHWPTSSSYNYLRGRLRSAHKVDAMRIRSTANPGGPGHQWVKAKFIDPAPGGYTLLRDPDTSGRVVFIPSKLSDNKILLISDPDYANRLKGLGSAALVAAMLNGDWSVIEGAFFDCWSSKQHVLRPFTIPPDWPRFRSMDWGSYSPFSVGWWAVVNEDTRVQRVKLPRGAIVRYREWYGTPDPSKPGRGLKLSAGKVGEGIAILEKGEKVSGGVLDPSTFRADGGPPIAEMINKELIARKCAPFRPADNTRVSSRDGKDRRGPMSGWDQMRGRMLGTCDTDEDGIVIWETGRPMIYCFTTCVASIRTIPILQHDKIRAEDLDTGSEDHAADDWRYACNSRPYARPLPVVPKKPDAYRDDRDMLTTDNSFMVI
jgi:hypothetical protein